MESILPPPEHSQCGVGLCGTMDPQRFPLHQDCVYPLKNNEGGEFILRITVDVVLGRFIRMAHITIKGDESDVSDSEGIEEGRNMSFPIGINAYDYSGFFIPATSQLGVIAEGTLLLWTLSTTAPWLCRLALIWKFQEVYGAMEPTDSYVREIGSAESCVHGRRIKLQLTAPRWYRYTVDVTDEVAKLYGAQKEGILTIPWSAEDTFDKDEGYRVNRGIVELFNVYSGGNEPCKQAIIQYLKSRIRPNARNRVSSLIPLCESWRPQLRKQLEALLTELLPTDHITWVPDMKATDITWVPDMKATEVANPLAIILKSARTQSSALGAARIIMNYCVSHANRSRNLAFLSPFFSCLHEVMEMYPDEVYRYLGRVAFVPVMHRSYILNNRIVAYPPSFRWKFWKPSTVPFYKLKDPIFQLHISAKAPDPNNEKFTRPVFMASFDALWHYRDAEKQAEAHLDTMADTPVIETTTWWKALFHMFVHKTKLKRHTYVEAYDFTIEFYDNPAIAALVAYKW